MLYSIAKMEKLSERKFAFIWKIENFSYIWPDFAEFVCSPAIVIESIDKSDFLLEFCSRGSENLELLIIKRYSFGIKYKVEVLHNNGFEALEMTKSDRFLLKKDVLESILKANGDNLTFRGHLSMEYSAYANFDYNPCDYCEALTKPEIEKDFFQSMVKMQEEDTLIFSVTKYFNLNLTIAKDFIAVKIQNKDWHKGRRFHGQLLLIDIKTTKSVTFEVEHYFSADEKEWTSPSNISCGCSDMYYFSCNLSTSGKKIDSVVYKCKNDVLPVLPTLQDNFRNLFNTKRYWDFQVNDIKAHKLILKARCPRLMNDGRENISRFVNYSLQTVRNYLLFVYTDDIEDSDETNVAELMEMANEFRNESLKAKCIS